VQPSESARPNREEVVELGRDPGPSFVSRSPRGGDRNRRRSVEGVVEGVVEGLERRDRPDDTRPRSRGSETLLMTVDVLAEARVPRDTQRHVSGLAGVHDGARPTVTDDDARVSEHGHEVVMGEELVSFGHGRRPRDPVLDHEAHVLMAEGRGIDPLHHPIEPMMIGPGQGHHEGRHRKGPTRWASG
jgi:hypothetical protein